jgi:hypothetical protein
MRIENNIGRCGYGGEGCQMTIVAAEGADFRTIIWLVPEGSKPPIPDKEILDSTPKAFIFDDFEKVSEAYYMHSFYGYFNKLIKEKTSMGVVIHYPGKNDNEIGYLDLMKENAANHPLFIENNLKARIVVFEGEARETQQTFLWIVPKGARMPKP